MKLLHTCLRISNLDNSLKFYTQLGLKEVKRMDYTEQGFILVYLTDENENYELELTYNLDSNGYDIGNGFSHIAFGTSDLEAEYKKHKDLGYEVGELKGLPGQKPNYYFIKDPDGYLVEIIRQKKD